jgi:SNF2 family DNA or RNA helicase
VILLVCYARPRNTNMSLNDLWGAFVEAQASYSTPAKPPLDAVSTEKLHLQRDPMSTWSKKEPKDQFRTAWELAHTRSKLPRVRASRYMTLPLFPYQEEALGAMIQDNSGILADEMGVGKTAPAIAYMIAHKEEYPDKHQRGRIILVLPAGLVPKWYHEFERSVVPGFLQIVWAHTSVPSGLRIRDIPLEMARDADVLVVTYEGMMQEHRDWCEEDEDLGEVGVDAAELAAEAQAARTREESILYCAGNHR